MRGNSSEVHSRQGDIHPRLDEFVRRHLAAPWLAPTHAPTQQAMQPLLGELANTSQAIVLDSGCGDGASSLRLAYRHSEAIVLGLDKSAWRLQRLAPDGWLRRGNLRLCRVELAEAWRLLVQANVRLDRHYLFYPNPWPKSTHLHRRWHGHPAFPLLLALGGQLELRSNWLIYAREFRLALALAGFYAEVEAIPEGEPAVTPFEQKYKDSGHRLWRVCADLRRSM